MIRFAVTNKVKRFTLYLILWKHAIFMNSNKIMNILLFFQVWNFFVDLKIKALSGVRCRYCEWITNDRSPTTLKFHLKRKHDTGLGGIWNIVEERIGISAPHNRSRTNKNVCYM